MKEQDFQIRVIRFLSGELSADEQDHLLKSLEKSAEKQKFFEEYREIWNKTDTISTVPDTDIDLQWQKFEEKAFSDRGPRNIIPLWGRPLFKIAAMVAILISSMVAWSILTTNKTDSTDMVLLQTSMEVQQFALPDGSKIWLNKESKVQYAKDFHPRQIFLQGEALFEVQHLPSDESFSVLTDETKVTVLGTKFLVKSGIDAEPVKVFVQEGKVAFENLQGDKGVAILTAGEQAEYDHDSKVVSKLKESESNLLSWKTGSFSFDDTPLSDILPVLEQHYGVDFNIKNPGLLNCTFKSEFSNMNLSEMLEELSFGLNLEIKQNSAGIFEIDGIPCK